MTDRNDTAEGIYMLDERIRALFASEAPIDGGDLVDALGEYTRNTLCGIAMLDAMVTAAREHEEG